MCNKKSIKEIKYNTKKKTTSYKEQCKEKVNKYLNEIKNFSEEDIVYIDETGIQGYIYREYARAIRGKKVYDKIPGKKYKRTNIVAGKCGDKIISPLVYDKIMDSKFFEKWFKEMFLNEVEKNKAIVMDNATFHCKSRLYELCKNANKNLKLIFSAPIYGIYPKLCITQLAIPYPIILINIIATGASNIYGFSLLSIL